MKVLRLKTQHFDTKLPCQKPKLRQIEWRVHIGGLIRKNKVLLVTTLFLWNFCFNLKTSHKELIWCTNCPNVLIGTFCKRWNFIYERFFPVSILNDTLFSWKLFFPYFRTRIYWNRNFTCPDFSHMFRQYNMFFMWVTRNIERFQYFNFETNFLKNEKLFQNTGVQFFSWKYKDRKSNISNISKSDRQQNCPVRSHVLRQIEWGVQNGPITKNRVLPVTALFFWKFCFNLRTSYEELIWFTNYHKCSYSYFS